MFCDVIESLLAVVIKLFTKKISVMICEISSLMTERRIVRGVRIIKNSNVNNLCESLNSRFKEPLKIHKLASSRRNKSLPWVGPKKSNWRLAVLNH